MRWGIGDVHGCLEELKMLISQVRHTDKDATFRFVGDYADRGPDSAGVIDLVKGLVEQGDAMAVRGNHDEMFIRSCLLETNYSNSLFESANEEHRVAILKNAEASMYGNVQMWMHPGNGGAKTIESYRGDTEKVTAHAQWLNTLPKWIADNGVLFVHAGCAPLSDDPAQAASLTEERFDDYLIWARNEFLTVRGMIGFPLFHGHTPSKTGPEFIGNCVNLDTACVFGGRLTAVCIETKQFTQVNRITK